MSVFWTIILLVLFGNLSGILLAARLKISKKNTLLLVGFVAGIILALSFIELLPESLEQLDIVICSLFFFLGYVFIWMSDKLLPHVDPFLGKEKEFFKKSLLTVILGVLLYNIPIGFGLSTSYLLDQSSGLRFMIGLIVHDFPKTLMTSLLFYSLTKNKLKSLILSLIAVLAELTSFLLGILIFINISPVMTAMISALFAGIISYLSIFEMLPLTSFKKDYLKNLTSFLSGVMVVVLVRILF